MRHKKEDFSVTIAPATLIRVTQTRVSSCLVPERASPSHLQLAASLSHGLRWIQMQMLLSLWYSGSSQLAALDILFVESDESIYLLLGAC